MIKKLIPNIFFNISSSYSWFDSFFYDQFIAPAAHEYMSRMDQLLTETPSGSHLLDVGCGGGHNLMSVIQTTTDIRITGLDLNPYQCQRVFNRTKQDRNRVNICQGNVLSLPFGDNVFDCVYSIGVIKHWPDHVQGVSECIRVLRPGGQLIIAEIDRGCSFQDAFHFIQQWRIPGFSRPIFLAFFRTWVAGQSIDLDEAKQLMTHFSLSQCQIQKISNTPALLIQGQK